MSTLSSLSSPPPSLPPPPSISSSSSSSSSSSFKLRLSLSKRQIFLCLVLFFLTFCTRTAQAFPPTTAHPASSASASASASALSFSDIRQQQPRSTIMRRKQPSNIPSSSLSPYQLPPSTKSKRGGGGGGGGSALFALPLIGSVMMDFSTNNPLWKAMGVYATADSVGFLISLATGSHVHLDLIGTGAFALFSVFQLVTASAVMTTSQKVSSIAVSIWAIKLASFLFYRAIRNGHDGRLEDTMSTVQGMFGFWFVTFLWNVCCSMPYLLGLLNNNNSNKSSSDPVFFLAAGSLLFGIGLVLETTADAQKWFFKQSNHPGQFCNVGLWSISQHPNFFGNLVLWAAILVMNIPALILPVAATAVASASSSTALASSASSTLLLSQLWSGRRLVLALISPLFMWGLFYGQSTGWLLNSTQLAASKYGSDPAYQRYLEEVPVIIPNLLRMFK